MTNLGRFDEYWYAILIVAAPGVVRSSWRIIRQRRNEWHVCDDDCCPP